MFCQQIWNNHLQQNDWSL